ncbi:multiple epidermal growth factor-like domains protein 10 [Ostrea edulis]|uniref:multiple epidermal growth factor-like domains protein 10 n=1 Tax=Ostrea edulis TaxID=37623 RepID=UPI0024AFDB35|nr:multiple epidermal growth factor-like domains protein 10 [Ostrea edulis]
MGSFYLPYLYSSWLGKLRHFCYSPCRLLLILNVVHANYVNVALHKPTSQWTTFPLFDTGSHKAVDGLKSDLSSGGSQCAISGNGQTYAEWLVDLVDLTDIHHIIITYRTDNVPWDINNGYLKRVLGFSLYVSNTTSRYDGTMCFKDTNYTIYTVPQVFVIDCPVYGRYVIYYNERLPGVTYPADYSSAAFNDLCEVEVYACPPLQFYGENCSLPCPQGCQKGLCDSNGNCFSCIEGYKGLKCDQPCDGKMFGQNCSRACGPCLGYTQCNHINGTCVNGCERGFGGSNCSACPEGFYGDNCQETCNHDCGVPRRCDRVTGECEGGCQPGWKGLKCDEHCEDRTYGINCSETCGFCRESQHCHSDDDHEEEDCTEVASECDHVNGTCMEGCGRGYRGGNCTEPCPVGFYGYNCHATCNHDCGVPGRCDRVTGECEGGCQPGWKDLKCDQHCEDRTYGINCSKTCGFCHESVHCHFDDDHDEEECTEVASECDHVNGTCMEGCGRGYRGENCTEPCPAGLYGYNCQETCNHDCGVPGRCDSVTGECEGGCQPGWIDPKCDEHCPERTYGINCSKTCGFCRESRHDDCHSSNSTSVNGTYINSTCLDECDKEGHNCTKESSECDHVTGECVNGCAVGYQGENCTEKCKEGFHGLNCSEICNRVCRHTCHHITGLCPEVPESSLNVGVIAGTTVSVFVVLAVIGVALYFRRLGTTNHSINRDNFE